MATLAAGSGAQREPIPCVERSALYAALPTDALAAEPQRRPARPSKADGLLALWSDTRPAVRDAHVYGVREVLHWDEGGEQDWVLFFFVRRRADLAPEAFEERYRSGHSVVARAHHPGVVRYVQNFVESAGEGAPRWDAIAQLHFASEGEVSRRFYRDEESPAAVAADVAGFLDPGAGFTLVTRRVDAA
jgi:hypothetical protein